MVCGLSLLVVQKLTPWRTVEKQKNENRKAFTEVQQYNKQNNAQQSVRGSCCFLTIRELTVCVCKQCGHGNLRTQWSHHPIDLRFVFDKTRVSSAIQCNTAQTAIYRLAIVSATGWPKAIIVNRFEFLLQSSLHDKQVFWGCGLDWNNDLLVEWALFVPKFECRFIECQRLVVQFFVFTPTVSALGQKTQLSVAPM